jgi:nucleoid DNA-binding protein
MERYGKDYLIHEIASRANFTVGDVKIIFNTFEDIVKEVVLNQDELVVGGLFKIYTNVSEGKGAFDIKQQKHIEYNKRYRLTISPSTTLKKITKTGKIDNNPPEM